MCKACGKWHDLDKPWPIKCFRGGNSHHAPFVISDNMAPAKHMATGQVIDSKAKFRQATKAAGCIELGNEPIKSRAPIPLDRSARREAIKKSIYHLRNGISTPDR